MEDAELVSRCGLAHRSPTWIGTMRDRRSGRRSDRQTGGDRGRREQLVHGRIWNFTRLLAASNGEISSPLDSARQSENRYDHLHMTVDGRGPLCNNNQDRAVRLGDPHRLRADGSAVRRACANPQGKHLRRDPRGRLRCARPRDRTVREDDGVVCEAGSRRFDLPAGRPIVFLRPGG